MLENLSDLKVFVYDLLFNFYVQRQHDSEVSVAPPQAQWAPVSVESLRQRSHL